MKNKKLKIGLVYGNLNVGGGAYQLLSLANILRKNNEVTVFVYKNLVHGKYLKLAKNIVIKEVLKTGNTKESVLSLLFEPFIVSFKLAKLINKYDVDILNPHEWPASWACVFVKLYKRIPVVWMCNDVWHLPNEGSEMRLRFNFMKKSIIKVVDLFLALFIDKIVVLDNRIKGIVKSYYHKNAVVIRSGIDLNDYKNEISRAGAREQLKIDKKNLIFVCFSIFFPHRRFEDVIEAFRRLHSKNSNVGLMIIGSSQFDQNYYWRIKKLIENYSLQAAVDIKNAFLPGALVRNYLIASDVFVFPNEKQTWGLAVIEAMALGRPCIVSDDAGVHEVIKNGENSLIFKCRDVDDLLEKMEKLVKDEKLREKMGSNARKFVFANFSWEKYAEQMTEIFQTVTK